jgi:type I restriction enzyme S subunit
LATLARHITDGSHNPPKGVPASEYLMLSSKNVFDDDLHYEDPRYLSAASFRQEDKRTRLAPGDVLLTIVGTVGRCAVVPADAPNITLQRSVAVIRVDPDAMDPRYLMYFFFHRSDDLNRQARGVAQKGIYLETLRGFEIKYPPLVEQRRIVAVLDKAFGCIATAKANAEKNLQNAGALFESQRHAVITRRRHGWVDETVETLAKNLDSKRVPVTKSDRRSGEFPYYGASGIVDYVADFIFEGDALLVSEDGANLLARSTPIAFSVSGKYWVNNHAHVLKFDDIATQRFVENFLESIPLDKYVRGAAQPKLTQRALNSIAIPIPSSATERATIVASIESLEDKASQLEETYVRKLTALDELKQSLLHQAFTGNL